VTGNDQSVRRRLPPPGRGGRDRPGSHPGTPEAGTARPHHGGWQELQHPNHDGQANIIGAEDIYGSVATPHVFSNDPYFYLGTHNVWHMRYSDPYN